MKIGIYGHTYGAVYNKEFLTELEFNRLLELDTKKSKKIQNLEIYPRLRQIKLEFTRAYMLVNIYRPKDFKYKSVVSKFSIDYREIDHVEIHIIGNNNIANILTL